MDLRSFWHRRRRWIILITVVLVVRALLPLAVRHLITTQASKAINARVEVANVDLWLLRGGIALDDVRVIPTASGAAAPDPVVTWKRLKLGLRWWPLVHRTAHLREIEFDTPMLNVERLESGDINLAALVPAPSPDAAPAAPAAPSPPWGVVIDRFALRSGTLRFQDHMVAGSEPIMLSLNKIDVGGLALRPGSYREPSQLHVDLNFDNAIVAVDAKLAVEPPYFLVEADINAERLPLQRTRLYVPNVGWSELTGEVTAALHYEFEAGLRHALRGQISVDDLTVQVAGLDLPALYWRHFGVDIDPLDLVANRIALPDVRLDGLLLPVRATGPEPLPILSALTKPDAAPPDPAAPAPPSAGAGRSPVAVVGGHRRHHGRAGPRARGEQHARCRHRRGRAQPGRPEQRTGPGPPASGPGQGDRGPRRRPPPQTPGIRWHTRDRPTRSAAAPPGQRRRPGRYAALGSAQHGPCLHGRFDGNAARRRAGEGIRVVGDAAGGHRAGIVRGRIGRPGARRSATDRRPAIGPRGPATRRAAGAPARRAPAHATTGGRDGRDPAPAGRAVDRPDARRFRPRRTVRRPADRLAVGPRPPDRRRHAPRRARRNAGPLDRWARPERRSSHHRGGAGGRRGAAGARRCGPRRTVAHRSPAARPRRAAAGGVDACRHRNARRSHTAAAARRGRADGARQRPAGRRARARDHRTGRSTGHQRGAERRHRQRRRDQPVARRRASERRHGGDPRRRTTGRHSGPRARLAHRSTRRHDRRERLSGGGEGARPRDRRTRATPALGPADGRLAGGGSDGRPPRHPADRRPERARHPHCNRARAARLRLRRPTRPRRRRRHRHPHPLRPRQRRSTCSCAP